MPCNENAISESNEIKHIGESNSEIYFRRLRSKWSNNKKEANLDSQSHERRNHLKTELLEELVLNHTPANLSFRFLPPKNSTFTKT